MTHYSLFCPICGADSVARVKGEPTDFRDGYTSHSIDGVTYIHEEEDPYGPQEAYENQDSDSLTEGENQ